MELSKNLELAAYFDVYRTQLTAKQSEIFHLYYDEDLSLSEIAQITHTSRQAVSDSLARTKKKLRQLEDGLGLVRREMESVDGI